MAEDKPGDNVRDLSPAASKYTADLASELARLADSALMHGLASALRAAASQAREASDGKRPSSVRPVEPS